ncbi:MAG: four helix bundle protein [Patescibacteria group bacterium]
MDSNNQKPNYEKLEIWQEAIKLTSVIYLITKNFPKEEQFGITSQLRRAILSVPLNIAEGQGRKSKLDFRRFLLISMGSLNETLTILTVSKNLKIISDNEYQKVCERILILMRRVQSLITKLQ